MERDISETEAELDHWKARAEKAEAALKPLAVLEIPAKPQGNAGAYSIRHSDIAAARAALKEQGQ